MLALDSLVLDLIFEADAPLDPESLIAALGGEEAAGQRLLIDPDQQAPEFEMQVAPSIPLRREGERRLLVIDDSVAPMRSDPQSEPRVTIDLRPEKERLLAACDALPVRIGRLFALGSWGDAVITAKRARDLRAVSLISWALDPSIDVDGRRRASPLSENEIKEKLYAYDKRLEELDEQAILSNLGPASLERRGERLVVSVLEADGTWDTRNSQKMEAALAAIERFALFPGAPAAPDPNEASRAPSKEGSDSSTRKEAAPEADDSASAQGEALRFAEVEGRLVVVFSRDRFNLDAAAAMGTGAWEDLWAPQDPLDSNVRDRIRSEGAGFVAPLEFLSEVFVEGVPLSRPVFEQNARTIAEAGARVLEVHCPRFGPALLVDIPERGRFLTSEIERPEKIVDRVL